MSEQSSDSPLKARNFEVDLLDNDGNSVSRVGTRRAPGA